MGICKGVDKDVKHQSNLAIEALNEVKSKNARINEKMASLTADQNFPNIPLFPRSLDSTITFPSFQPLNKVIVKVNVDVYVTSERIHLYFLCIVT